MRREKERERRKEREESELIVNVFQREKGRKRFERGRERRPVREVEKENVFVGFELQVMKSG